ncbi:hypothetical protein M885DRAFT_507385 [Pelagophyceae sp. CCMP2097]|nr:hypothetical protein M885DRAFT_507385 [Pelagophyceae sp. CCMP2097]
MAEVKAWKAEYRSVAQRVHAAELEQRAWYSTRDAELQKDARLCRDDEAAADARRGAAKAGMRLGLRTRAAELDRVREQVDALRRGDATRAAAISANRRKRRVQRPDVADAPDDDLGLAAFDAELAAFRDKMRRDYDELRTEERALCRDVDACKARFEAWKADDDDADQAASRRPATALKTRAAPPTYEDAATAEAELRALDAELADVCGGWHPDEHATFVRLWLAVHRQGADVAAKALAERALKSRDARAIASHADWWARRHTLVARKRELVDNWRGEKQQAEASKVQRALAVQAKIDAAKTADVKKERQESAVKRGVARERAQAWREDKEATAAAAAAAEQETKDRDAERARHAAAAQRAERRGPLADYKQRKQLERAIAQEEVVLERDLKSAERTAPRKRDLDLHAKKALDAARARRDRTEAVAESSRRDERLRAVAQRDPAARRDASRVLRPTSSSRYREFSVDDVDEADGARANESAHSRPIAGGGYDLRHGIRATPAWRGNLR